MIHEAYQKPFKILCGKHKQSRLQFYKRPTLEFPMPDINERRLLQRTNLALYLKVLDSSKNESLGNIIDINVCGFLLLTKLTLQEKAQYSVKIELPDGFNSDKHVECTAIVRRVAKSVNPSFNEIGLEISEITPDARELVEQLEQQLILKFSND